MGVGREQRDAHGVGLDVGVGEVEEGLATIAVEEYVDACCASVSTRSGLEGKGCMYPLCRLCRSLPQHQGRRSRP
jgi:hypothetical protein